MLAFPVSARVGHSGLGIRLRTVAVAAGFLWSAAFILVGVGAGLQMFGDGAIFSYMVAVQDAWAFHWSNIAGRVCVYLLTVLPGEIVVALSGSASAGVTAYGLLWFAAPLAGLVLTARFDRSPERTILTFACASTACLCPFGFGFPTEMWMAHALFWPALAACHYAGGGIGGIALVFAALLALVLTHEGAVVLALAILATLALRGWRDHVFLRGLGALTAALAVWAAVKAALPPDDYFGSVVVTAALFFIDPANLAEPVVVLTAAALAGCGILSALLARIGIACAEAIAAIVSALLLAAYWLGFDRSLSAADRYELRTVLLIGTPAFGAFAAAFALRAEGRLALPMPLLPQVLATLAKPAALRMAAGALVLVTLVHVVETAKFAAAWSGYKAAVRALAAGPAADPDLGDPRFVSSVRLGARLNRLAWFSTTPYLSVLLAPNMAPERLVIDPGGDYFWLACATAKANEAASRAVPADSRRLVRHYNCLHRP
jgi:hypothetical protein